jgi:hypothetical protein
VMGAIVKLACELVYSIHPVVYKIGRMSPAVHADLVNLMEGVEFVQPPVLSLVLRHVHVCNFAILALNNACCCVPCWL